MKRWIAAVAVAGLLAFSGSAWAQGVHGVSEDYNDDLTHPLHGEIGEIGGPLPLDEARDLGDPICPDDRLLSLKEA